MPTNKFKVVSEMKKDLFEDSLSQALNVSIGSEVVDIKAIEFTAMFSEYHNSMVYSALIHYTTNN